MTPEELVKFTGITRPEVVSQAETALSVAESIVDAYTRGRHVDASGEFRTGVEGVVTTVAARILSNPEQVSYREQAGPYSLYREAGYQGLSLTEQLILDRYRKRGI
ncbi:hypothetical protein [Corynebacterium flavescens]|uniref:hypothetical protein n=1 Tax=Corynebacterium flavescens TaxID=28028 RepID=UPI003FD1B89B